MAVNENTLIDAGVRVGLLAAESLRDLRLQAKRERLKLQEVVMRAGRFPEAALYQALATVRNIPFFQGAELDADREVLAEIPRNIRQSRPLLPVSREGRRYLVLADPDDRLSLERVERVTGKRFLPALAEPEALKRAIQRSGGEGALTRLDAATEDPVALLDEIMKESYLRRASDIHLEPSESGMHIRFRVDGRLQEFSRVLGKEDEEALMNRVKVLAGLDIAEQRMAQDGAMNYAVSTWKMSETDIRVATIPTRWGERATLRILGQETGNLSLEELGMPELMLDDFRVGIRRPHGIILVTGPTGSGKSTTLYAAIRELNVGEINVLTVEDPVEQVVEGVNQVQVGTKIGFAQALRSFLRHDPDVILVGEIRDQETVDIALRSAMTGHLVLSTLHTNDSVGAVTRLADMGAERFLIGSTVIGILAQRLVRRLCVHCRKGHAATAKEKEILGLEVDEEVVIYGPGGCSFCLGSGFRGRIGVFEVLWMNRELRLAVAEGAGERQIATLAAKSMTTLWQDACAKVRQGDASLEEVLHLQPEI